MRFGVGTYKALTLQLLIVFFVLNFNTKAALAQSQLALPIYTGKTIRLNRPAANIFIAEPTIADIQVASNQTVFLFGKKVGRTTLFALDDQNEQIAQYQIVITEQLGELRRILQHELGSGLHVVSLPGGLMLTGVVADPDGAEAARSIASQYLGQGATIINRLKVGGRLQVSLRVRIAEVSKNVTKELGVNWSAIGSAGEFAIGLSTGRVLTDAGGALVRAASGAGNVSASLKSKNASLLAVVDALAADGLINILAQPNLTSSSGEPASFLAGGEFPIPVAQPQQTISVEYRKFGVSLEFVPTVVSNNLINLRIKPEVSDLSDQGAVSFNGFNIPAIQIRRAETTVDVASGQSFAIGGLIRNNSNTTISQFPGLGDIPVLGALFRSSNFQRNQTELIIIVTPYIVRPTSNPTALRTASELARPASDVDRVFANKLTSGDCKTAGSRSCGLEPTFDWTSK